jgi:uncharacterized membrane protein HdeD (DUF308 family)
MKQKQKVDLVVAIALILLGIVLILLPNFKINDVSKILFVVMMVYATLNMIQFILTKNSKDYEGLFTSILSYVIGISGLVFNLFDNPLNLAVTLFSWIILMSLIKFKKCDYYNDRKNKMWIIRIVTLILFIITGILTCINLYYSKNIQVLLIGLFFYIHGILEIIDPLTIYLMGDKNESC